MAKKMYAIVDGKTKKVRKNYAVVNGKIKKVRKGYTVVAGKIRPFWTGGELAYYGTATPLSVGAFALSATSVGNYALFGGGCSYISTGSAPETINKVTTYNQRLTRSTASSLSEARQLAAAGHLNNYALFAGGAPYAIKTQAQSSVVDAYDKNLTKTVPTALGRSWLSAAAAQAGNYLLFAGGYNRNGDSQGMVYAYDENLTQTLPTVLHAHKTYVKAASVGGYGVFAGGNEGSSASLTVDAYDENLTRSRPENMNNRRIGLGAATVGTFALFAGGQTNNNTFRKTVETYDENMTHGSAPDLSTYVYEPATSSVGNYAVFGGGYDYPQGDGSSSTLTDIVSAYDENLTRTTPTPLSLARRDLAAATVGQYSIFAGGFINNSPYNSTVADVYTAG